MEDNQKEKEIKNTWDIWNPIMKRFEPNRKIFTQEEKNKSMNNWVDRIGLMFEKYRDEFEKTPIVIPLFTAKIFAKHGAIDYKDIDMSERNINLKIDSQNLENKNEDLIYKAFDKIIQNEKHIEDYLNKQRGKYSTGMPF